jgi:hypothetical protein
MSTSSSATDLEARDWLHDADDDILGCRGQGHNWPKLRPGRTPRGLAVEGPFHDGVMEIIYTCRDCGKKRRLITAPNGVLDLPAQYSYKDPPGYKTPKGSGITRRQCLEETWRRSSEELIARARMDSIRARMDAKRTGG